MPSDVGATLPGITSEKQLPFVTQLVEAYLQVRPSGRVRLGMCLVWWFACRRWHAVTLTRSSN
jgi:hypothetical protein